MLDNAQITSLLRDVLNEVALKDQDSIFERANSLTKEFLTKNTSVDDNQKAQVYANFVMQVVSGAIGEAIRASNDSVLRFQISADELDEKARQFDAELDEKSNQFDAELAEKTRQFNDELTLKNNELALKQDELDEKARQFDAELDLKGIQVDAEVANILGQLELTKANLALKNIEASNILAEIQAKLSQIEANKSSIELDKLRAEIANADIPLKEAQALLYEAQSEVESSKYQRNLIEANSIAASLEANADIERMKCQKDVDIAYIYTTGDILGASTP